MERVGISALEDIPRAFHLSVGCVSPTARRLVAVRWKKGRRLRPSVSRVSRVHSGQGPSAFGVRANRKTAADESRRGEHGQPIPNATFMWLGHSYPHENGSGILRLVWRRNQAVV